MTTLVDSSVIEWLLEPDDPPSRWLALRLLLDRPADDPEVVEAQRAIPGSPIVTSLLDGQSADGSWERGKTSRPRYAATVRRLAALADLGMPGDHPAVTAACDLLLERTELPGEGFCARMTRPRMPHECGQAAMLFVFNHFGYGNDKRVKAAGEWLLANQMLDGGWNCAHHPKGRLQPDGSIRMDHECSLELPHQVIALLDDDGAQGTVVHPSSSETTGRKGRRVDPAAPRAPCSQLTPSDLPMATTTHLPRWWLRRPATVAGSGSGRCTSGRPS